jgi:endonuclease III
MDRIGFLVDCSLARVLGSMALMAFSATSIIALILSAATTDRSLVAAKRRSTTSTPTKPEMAEAMSAELAMVTATKSMLSPAQEAEAEVAARREIRWDK